MTWKPPLYTGGGTITGYSIAVYTTSGGAISDSAISSYSVTTSSTTTPQTVVTGLVNGTSYVFSVSAVNKAGQGPPTMTNVIIPKAQPATTTAPVTPAVQTPPAAAPVFSSFIFNSTLRKGIRGAAVRELQKRLTAEGFYGREITGYFGPVTEAALKAYQRAWKIPATGVLGPLTRAQLNAKR